MKLRIYPGNFHGGIVGAAFNVKLLGCTNTGTIYGRTHTGGIVGAADNEDTPIEKKLIISNCTNSGLVKSHGIAKNYSSVGGICGYIGVRASIENCINTGEITGNTETIEEKGIMAGGVIGQVNHAAEEVNISKCKNTGKVHFNTDSGSARTTGGLGGIAGTLYDTTTIDQCYNTGEITSNYKMNHVAGILGYSYGTTIKNSYNIGSICGYNEIGGIVGESNVYKGNNTYVYNSYNATESVLGNSVVGNGIGNCMYTKGSNVGYITGKAGVGKSDSNSNIVNAKTYTLAQMKTLNSGLLTLLNTEEGQGMWAQETGVNDNLPYLVNNRP